MGFIFFALLTLSACSEQSVENNVTDSVKHHSPDQKSSVINKQQNLNKENSSPTDKAENPDLPPQQVLFLSSTFTEEASEESTQFNCEDQIFLIIKFINNPPKLHQIQAIWKDPNGQERENNSFPFFVSERTPTAWVSLKLHRSVGAGMLQWINPAAGMEEFIGNWTVDVKVGSLLKETLKFEVLC